MIKKWVPTILGIVAVVGILLFSVQQIFIKTTLTEQEIVNRIESLYNGSVEDITKNGRHYNVVFSDSTKVYEVVVDEEQGTFHDLKFIADRAGSLTAATETNDRELTTNEVSNSTENQDVVANDHEQTPPTSKPTASNPAPNPGSSNSSSVGSSPNSSNNSGARSSGTQAPAPAPVHTPPPATPVRISEAAANQIALQQLNGEIDDIEFYSTADGGYYIVDIETEKQEASFQIHAITGKILSVVYDD